MPTPPIEKTPYDHLYFIGLIALVAFFAFFQTATMPLLDAVESRNGVNALEMWQTHDFAHVTYGNRADVWNAKPPLSIWLTAAAFRIFGLNEFALRLPMSLATIFLFIFLYRIIRLYQQADFAFYACLLLLTVKGLVGRHVADLGQYDAVFTCFAVGGTFFFLRYFDFKKRQSVFWAALFFGLSFLSKGFGVFVFLLGLMMYMLARRQFFTTLFSKNFFLAILMFAAFPVLWLWLNNWNTSTTFQANIDQEFLAFLPSLAPRNWLLFYDYLAKQFEWWHWLFLVSIPVGLTLIFRNSGDLKANFTTALTTFEPTAQLPRNRHFTLRELLARPDLKPNIQLLLLSICIWLVLAVVCTLTQNEQYLAFALPFIAITTAACIFYFNNRWEWFRFIFIALLVFTFWGQLDFYLKDRPRPAVIVANEALLKGKSRLTIDDDLPTQNVLLYLRFFQPNLTTINSSKAAGDLIFCRADNQDKYPSSSVIYEDEEYVLLAPIFEDQREM